MARLLLILEADAYGIPLQNAKLFVFKHGSTNVNGPFGIPTGLGLSGNTFDDPDAGTQLSAAGSSLQVITDNTGQKYVWMDSADVVDVVVTDNNHQAYPLGQPGALATFNNYMKVILPVPQVSTTTIPSAVDFKVTYDGTNAVSTSARPGAVNHTGTMDAVLNGVMIDNSVVGPAGSETLGTPGVTIQIINAQTNNAAVPVFDEIGKCYAGGVTGTFNNGSAVLTDSSNPFTPAMVGRLIYLRNGKSGAPNPKDLHAVIASYQTPSQVTLDRNTTNTVAGSAQWSIPITIGMHIIGQGGGTRNQGNNHPDDGTLMLQCSGGSWKNKSLVNFRNAPNWTTQGFGSEIFEIDNIALDANDLADYALNGIGVGTGNASTCHDYTAQGAVVANIAIGNHFDAGGSSDVFHTRFISSNPITAKTTTISGGFSLPAATITVASQSNFQNEGFLEIPSASGTQLVHYTGKSGTNQFTGCIGGTGAVTNGVTIKQWAYGFEVNQGDVYQIDDFNIAVGSHAILINMSNAAICMIGRGHLGGGGGGGAVIVVPYCNQLVLGPGLYVDNISATDVGGLWIVPMDSQSTTQVISLPGTKYNVNDQSFPIVLDGANGGSGVLYQLSGFTNGFAVTSGNQTTVTGNQALPAGSIAVADTSHYSTSGWIGLLTDRGKMSIVKYTSVDATHFLGCTGGAGTAQGASVVTQATILVYFKNGWPANRGVSIDHWQARACMGIYYSDNATTPDYIGTDIVISQAQGGTSWIPTAWKGPNSPTSSRPTPDWIGPGSTYRDTTFNRQMVSDGTGWWPQLEGRYYSIAASAGAAQPDMALGDYCQITQATIGGFAVQAPSHATAGETLNLEVKNTSAGNIQTNLNAVFVETGTGAPSFAANLAAGKRRNITFRYDGTNWIEFARSIVDY